MVARFFNAICCCAMLTGCFSLPWKKKAMIPPVLSFPPANVSDGTKHEPRLVGRVAMVNTEGHFVLLECDAWTPPAEGTALKCFRYNAETGIVSAGRERRGEYVVADIVKGEPQRGDQVFQ
jgi:hypothetical protein